MAISQGKEGQIQKDVEQALRIAKKAWEGSDMPQLSFHAKDDTIKVALAILASAVLTTYGNR